MRPEPPTTADQATFLSALAEWSGRPFDDFPSDAPPCGALGSITEDRTLAAIFAGLASIDTPNIVALRMDRLHELNKLHERHYLAALNADPRAVEELAVYRRMIDVIRSWFVAIYEDVLGVAA